MLPKIGDLPINGACATQSCVKIYRIEAPGDVAQSIISPLVIERVLEDKMA